MTKTIPAAAGLSVKKGALDSPPPYATPTDRSRAPIRSTTGLLDFTHLRTLTPEQLLTFDAELASLSREWLSVPKISSGVGAREFRDWLRGYGFFVSLDPMKYRRRGLDEARPLGDRVACMLASNTLGPSGDCGVSQAAFWTTLGELLEVRGLAGAV